MKLREALKEVLKTEDEWRFIEPDLPDGMYSVWADEYDLPETLTRYFVVNRDE